MIPFRLGDESSRKGLLVWFVPIPFDKVYEPGSKEERLGCWEGIFVGGGNEGAGGGVAGVECFNGEDTGGGGGGGAEGELGRLPNAFRAACIATD